MKTSIKKLLSRWLTSKVLIRRYKALVAELNKLPVIQSGITDSVSWIELQDGTRLFGQVTDIASRKLYQSLRKGIRAEITEEIFRVAVDVVTRYMFPHALPGETVPYPRRLRRGFHFQHVETIEDMPISGKWKRSLRQIFQPRPGETFVDIGAYMGYGTLRLAQLLGAKSKIVAVEADSDALQLLRWNIEANNLHNVTIVPKAMWKSPGCLKFYRTAKQANSLIDDVLRRNGSSQTIQSTEMKTDTVDRILQQLRLTAGLVSITVNGAEVEVLEGMKNTLQSTNGVRLTIAGWYRRDGRKICEIVEPKLHELGFEVVIGRLGRVLAWKV